ncbi:MAG TPA: hypothetical protein VEF76_01315 [Patescibacteria group bacterium]|nr:hypothetical protein [Patescibacteria group bacterium]
MRKLIPAVFALTLMATSPLAYADTATPEGAASIKTQVEQALAFPMDLAKTQGDGLTLSGPVEVTPKGEYYEVKMPGATVVTSYGFKFDMGTLIANVSNGQNGALNVAIALPQTMKAIDETAKPIAELKIGKQRFSGVWRPDLATFTDVAAEYNDVTINSLTPGEFAGTVAALTTTMHLTENGDGTWSGPYGIGGSGIKLDFKKGTTANIAIGGMKADSSYDKIDLKARKRMQDTVSETLKKGQQAPTSPDQAGQMMSNVMSNLSGYLDGMGSNLELTDVSVVMKSETPAQPNMPAPADFKAALAKLGFVFDVRGMLQDKGTTTVKVMLDGLNVSDTDPGVQGLIPTQSNFEVYVENLPMRDLGKSIGGALETFVGSLTGVGAGQVDPAKQAEIQQQAQMQMMMLMTTLPQQLVNAGTTISVRNTYTRAADLSTTLDGQFKANAASSMMADGSMTLTLTGVDETILKLQSQSQAANANPRLAGYATGLSMIQGYTKPEKDASGRSLRKLTLAVDATGNATLNGQPLNALVQGVPGGDIPGGVPNPVP